MSTVIRSYRIRAYPNAAQARLIDRYLGAARWLWNTALEVRSEFYRYFKQGLTGVDLSQWLTQWKRTAGHEWLADIPATCLTQVLRDQDVAFSRFYKKQARYPKYKKKQHAGTLRFQNLGVAWDRGELKLPKLDRLKLAEALPAVTKPDTATLTRDAAGRYFVSFKAEVALVPLPATGRTVGVDLGLKHLAALSTGEKIAAPRKYARRLQYLRRQQRSLARRQPGSKRRGKQRLRVARAHARVADARNHELHVLTTRLVREHDTICIEDLNVKALGRGWHARSIHDAAFGEFRRQLTYKAAWYGRKIVAVDRFFPSSKRCSSCGHVLETLALHERSWRCPACGITHDRDVNAAINLEREGTRLSLAPPLLLGSDRREVCVDGRGSCRSASTGQVLSDEARSGQRNTAGRDPAALR